MIRPACAGDADGILEIYAPHVLRTPTSFETDVPTVEQMQRRIADTTKIYPWLVDERHGRLAGYAYATRHRVRAAYDWSVETSVYVHPEWHRQGVGRALYHALFEQLIRQGFVNAFAGIALPNPASVRLHESIGFEPIGVFRKIGFKQGAWHDVGWWQKVLQPYPASPSAPLPPGA